MKSKIAYTTLIIMFVIVGDSAFALRSSAKSEMARNSKQQSATRVRRDIDDSVVPQNQITPQRQRSMFANITNSPYMPNQEQLVQLLALILLIVLGPMVGPATPVVEQVVRQVLPVVVSAAMSYAASQNSQASGAAQDQLNGQQFNSQLVSPVEPPRSQLTQAL